MIKLIHYVFVRILKTTTCVQVGVCALLSLDVKAQLAHDYILKMNGSYSSIRKDIFDLNPLYTPPANIYNYGLISRNVESGVSLGKKIKTNLYYGVGLSYQKNREDLNPIKYIPSRNQCPGGCSSYSNSLVTSKTLSPSVFLQYNAAILEKVYFVFDVYSAYRWETSFDSRRLYVSNQGLGEFILLSQSEEEIKKQWLSIGLMPSIRVNIYKNFGVDLGLGVLQYSQKTRDSRKQDLSNKTNQFELSLRPEHWTIGLWMGI